MAAKTRLKNGEVDEVKWLEIDGLKGVQFREANPEKPDGIQAAAMDGLSEICRPGATGKSDALDQRQRLSEHQDAMYGVLYSTKIVH